METYHKTIDLLRGLEFARDPELESTITHADGTTRDVLVFLGDDGLEPEDREAIVGQFIRIWFDPDLPLQSTGHVGLQHARDGLYLLLQIFGHLLEPDQTDCAGKR